MEFQMNGESGFSLKTGYGDLPISPNDEDGYRPYQLLVASIVGCSANIFKDILIKMRMDLQNMEISTQVERNEEKANRIEAISIHFVLTGSNLHDDKVKRALALSRKNCGMIQTIENSVHVTETFEIVD